MATPSPAAKFTLVKPPTAKVIRLQKALRATDARTRRGSLPVVTGIVDTQTVEAVNYWNRARHGTALSSLTQRQVVENIDRLANEIIRDVPSIVKQAKPSVVRLTTPTLAVQKQAPNAIVGYTCMKGNCKPGSPTAKAAARDLQQLLNRFPKATIARYPEGQKLETVTGIIGKYTAAATSFVLGERMTPDDIARDVAGTVRRVTGKLAAMSQPERVQVPVLPPSPETKGRPAFQIITSGKGKGNATGNAVWRCIIMAIQIQLNRLGQALDIDGTLGQNTAKSVNKVLGFTSNPTPIREIAADAAKYFEAVKLKADTVGAPEPDPRAMGLARRKCAIETSAPVVDARYFAGQKVSEPVAAPTPKPVPPVNQPLPVPPRPKVVTLQSLLNQFPPQVIGGYFPGGKPLQVTGVVDEATASAVRGIFVVSARRLNMPPDPKASTISVAEIEGSTDLAIDRMRAELPLQAAYWAEAAGDKTMPPSAPGAKRAPAAHGRRPVRTRAPRAPRTPDEPMAPSGPMTPSPDAPEATYATPIAPTGPGPVSAGLTPEDESGLTALGIQIGLPDPETLAIIQAGKQSGQSPSAIADLLRAAATTRDAAPPVKEGETSVVEPGEPGEKKPFPIVPVLIGAGAVLGTGLLAYGIHRAARARKAIPAVA